MIKYDQDLFGGPAEIPRRGTRNYREFVAELDYPEGLNFWSLAPDCLAPGVPDWVECVWLTDRENRFVRMIIDLHTGKKWDGSRDEIG